MKKILLYLILSLPLFVFSQTPTINGTSQILLQASDTIPLSNRIAAKFTLPALTTGSVLFSDGTTIAQDNTNFFWNDSNNRFSLGGVANGKFSLISNSLGVTQDSTAGVMVMNYAPATVGAQQMSPPIIQGGSGWGTTGSAAQTVRFETDVLPVQGTVPTGLWQLKMSINNAAFANVLTVTSAGVLATTGTIASGGQVTAASSISAATNVGAGAGNQFLWAARSIMTAPSDGVIKISNNGLSDFNRLQFGGTTNLFPSWQRASAKFIARLADDSGNTNVEVKDSVYAASWNGNQDVPTKNAIYDRLQLTTRALADFYTDVNNSGTAETDIYSYTSPANTLNVDGDKITATFAGTLNDLTATAQIKILFGGTTIGNTGALTVSATGGFKADVLIIRSSSTTVRSIVNISTPGASTAIYTSETDLTGLTLSSTNILVITATAGGGTGGTGDITGKLGTIQFIPVAN